jgi:hypothetical protein
MAASSGDKQKTTGIEYLTSNAPSVAKTDFGAIREW